MEPTYHSTTDRRSAQSQVELGIIAALQARGVPLVPQVKIADWIFDGAIDGTRVLVEVHGDYWHTIPESIERDARKAAWAAREGYVLVTVWESSYAATPEAELARVEAAYQVARAGATVAPTAGSSVKSGTPRKRRRDHGQWRERFLAALAESGIVLDAAEAAGVNRETVRRHRLDEPAFDQAVKDAQRDAADRLRRVYRKRAEQQSDRAMEYMLGHLDRAAGLDVPALPGPRATAGSVTEPADGTEAIDVLRGAAGVAASQIVALIADPQVSPADRLRAAEQLLTRLDRAVDLEAILARLAALEESNGHSNP